MVRLANAALSLLAGFISIQTLKNSKQRLNQLKVHNFVEIDFGSSNINATNNNRSLTNETGTAKSLEPQEIVSNKEEDSSQQRNQPKANVLLRNQSDYSHVIKWEKNAGIGSYMDEFWKGNMFCRTIQPLLSTTTGKPISNSSKLQQPLLIDVNFNCRKLYLRSDLGTGNYITGLASIRLSARTLGGADVRFACADAHAERKALILPWFMGDFAESKYLHDGLNKAADTSGHNLPTKTEACASYDNFPLNRMSRDLLYDLRRMAIALVGIPAARDHPAHKYAERFVYNRTAMPNLVSQLPNSRRDDLPLYPDVELDHTIIHFRCGDLMNSNHPGFAYMPFHDYIRYIEEPANGTKHTIGIVTQPFENNNTQQRHMDRRSNGKKCRIVVTALVEDLQKRFPEAAIRIRNDAKETIALTYARMVMARSLVVGISSFGIFPALANFGDSFVRKPDFNRAPNQWVLHRYSPLIPKPEPEFRTVLFSTKDTLFPFGVRRRWTEDSTGQKLIWWFRKKPANASLT